MQHWRLEAGDWVRLRYDDEILQVLGVDRHWWYALVMTDTGPRVIHMDNLLLMEKGKPLDDEVKQYREALGGNFTN